MCLPFYKIKLYSFKQNIFKNVYGEAFFSKYVDDLNFFVLFMPKLTWDICSFNNTIYLKPIEKNNYKKRIQIILNKMENELYINIKDKREYNNIFKHIFNLIFRRSDIKLTDYTKWKIVKTYLEDVLGFTEDIQEYSIISTKYIKILIKKDKNIQLFYYISNQKYSWNLFNKLIKNNKLIRSKILDILKTGFAESNY